MKNLLTVDATLTNLTREELRGVATKLGVKRGRSGKETLANVAGAIKSGKARFSLTLTIRTNEDPTSTFAPAIFSKKLRTHKADKVIRNALA